MTTQQQQQQNRRKIAYSCSNASAMGYCWLGLLFIAGIQTCTADASLRSRNLIIGGSTAKQDRHPYYVALKDNNREIQCGGTLIAPDIVLTAAHCRGSNLVYADVGKYSKNDEAGLGEEIEILNPLEMMSSGKWSTVHNLETSGHATIDAAGFIHPGHNLDRRTFDVMLLKLARGSSRPLMKVNADPSVPLKQPGGRNEITIIGMGNTDSSGMWPKPNDLKQVHVNYLPYDECIDVENYNLDYKYELLPHMICVSGAGVYGDRGQCYGDSGGPYIMLGNDHTEDVQVGVVSWAVNCANPVFPMVGSRTSESIDFIKEITCSMSANPPADLCVEENNSVEDSLQNRWISDGMKISVRIFSDPFGHELKWKITDQLDQSKIYADIPYGKITGDHSFQDVVVPAGGNLKFQIDDAADDGIYGDPDAILYEIVLVENDGEIVMVEGNGQFGTSREETFRVPKINEEYLALVRASNAATGKNPATQVDGPTAPLQIYIEFADYHEDASWKITSLDGSKTYASKLANEYRYGNDVTEQVDLAAGEYKFTIADRRGTDDFRAFNFYKLSYLDSRQRSGGSGYITVYESKGMFEGEQESHEFVIPVSAVSAVLDGPSSPQEVVIDDKEFLAEAEIELCTLLTLGKYCTSNDQCCSENCSKFRCQAKDENNAFSTTTVTSRDRMREPVRGNAGGSSRGYART